MNVFLTFLIVLAMLGAAGAVLFGVIGMFRGASARRSNQLMQYRVLFQAVALGLLALFALVAHH
jgi:Hypoxia induced protein conserved region